MILVETEPALPAVVETAKAQVLTCLAAMHRVKDFTGRADLVVFLDEVLDGLVTIGAPRGLTRVLVFHRTPGVTEEVAKRLVAGGVLRSWQAPGCWMDLAKQLPDLKTWAARIDPGFENTPRGI